MAAITVLSGHVAPSVDDNNRYLKITPLRDGFRLAYTVFFGEIPGASERRTIDTNRDGRIDEAEAQRFAENLGAQVAAGLDVEMDGAAHRLRWDVVSAGMGSDAVAAGSFSVDLVAFVCGRGSGTHEVRVRDQFRITRPGETELKVEDSPGVTVRRAHVGPADDPSHDFRFAGPGGPLADDGLELDYTADDKAHGVPSDKCMGVTPAAKQPAGSRLGLVIVALAVVGGIAGLLLWRRRAALKQPTAS